MGRVATRLPRHRAASRSAFRVESAQRESRRLAEVASDCDPNLLEEVLLELGGNALRLMGKQGGTLRLGGRRRERRAILEVADTGPGIPEGVRDRVFDLFFTTRPDGPTVSASRP